MLANAIWDLLSPDRPDITGEVQYVLDGAALIHRIPWTRGATYKEICIAYTRYVMKKFREAIVVFDGYYGTSTKDMTHRRRAKGQAGATAAFTEDMNPQ